MNHIKLSNSNEYSELVSIIRQKKSLKDPGQIISFFFTNNELNLCFLRPMTGPQIQAILRRFKEIMRYARENNQKLIFHNLTETIGDYYYHSDCQVDYLLPSLYTTFKAMQNVFVILLNLTVMRAGTKDLEKEDPISEFVLLKCH